MRTSISKKLLAGALSVMMVLSLFAGVPANKAQAAASVKVTGKTAVYTGTTNTYKVVNLKKAQYVKVSVTGDAKKLVTVKKGGKKLATTKKVYGGKTITLKVANKKAAGKKYTLVVKAYKKGATKPFKTIKKTVTVYSKTTSVTLDQTEATLKVGETVTLTATKKPAKNTKAIKWTSSDEAVATVADGVVTAVAAGTATIKATSGAKSATATITVEEAKKEAELVDLKVTGSKVLTATLSATAEITEKDIVVKKGTVTITPAEVKVDGTSLVITLGSKISEGTYSLTYKEKTLEVTAEDEKLVELKTVGTALAQVSVPTATTANNGTNKDLEDTTLDAEIEYQALNQYGEKMNAEITNVTSTFGGAVAWSEPTAKKNGVITILNINPALGIVGTAGKIIIISKGGVSTTNDVTFSEEAKVAKIELKGIYKVSTGEFVETIPAQTAISDYKLIIKAYDQYENEISFKKYGEKIKNQNISVAQVLTNVRVAGATNGKLTEDSYEEVSIKDEDCVALKLESSNTDAKAAAGSVQIIVVGDRFGSVMNETIKIEQIALLKSFAVTANTGLYNNDENVLEFTAVDTNGKEVTDYKTLEKLVAFEAGKGMSFEKKADGTAKLIYKPAVPSTAFPNADNKKETTVDSVTITCNATISAADTLVVPKTFTVYENRVATSIVKYTGSLVTTGRQLKLAKASFVFEDQYGNTLNSKNSCYKDIRYDYKFGEDAAVKDYDPTTTDLVLDVINPTTKLYISIAGQTRKKADDSFDETKAQLELNILKGNSMKATNLKATWNGDGDCWYVDPNQDKSYVPVECFKVTGTIDGKKVTLPVSQYSIKKDTYAPISNAEAETAVKKATVTLTVTLTDADNKEYTEEITCDYEYSAAPAHVAGIVAYATTCLGHAASLEAGLVVLNCITTDELNGLFLVYDQYGGIYNTGDLTLEVSLGKNTAKWEVVKNNTVNAYVTYPGSATRGAELVVTATLRNGESATENVVIADINHDTAAAKKTDAESAIAAVNSAYSTYNTTKNATNWKAWKAAYDIAKNAVQAFVARGGDKSTLTGYTSSTKSVYDWETDTTANQAAVNAEITADLLKKGSEIVDTITLTPASVTDVDKTKEQYDVRSNIKVLVTYADGSKEYTEEFELTAPSVGTGYIWDSEKELIKWNKDTIAAGQTATVKVTVDTADANFTLKTNASAPAPSYAGGTPVITVSDPTNATISCASATSIKYIISDEVKTAEQVKASGTLYGDAAFDATAGLSSGTYNIYAIGIDANGNSSVVKSADIVIP